MENKDSNKNYMKHAKLSLLFVAGIHGLILAYSMSLAIQAQVVIAKFNTDPDLAGFQAPTVSIFDFIPVFSVLIIVGAHLAMKELSKEKLGGWLFALTVFLLAVSSWAMPVAGYGIYCLLHESVREKFLKELNSKINEI